MPGRYIGGSSAGLGKAQRIDNWLRADWLSCFSLAWWEWRVARQGCLVPLRKGGMWQSSRPASFSPAGLNLWPNWLERWLVTLSGLSTQVRIPVGLSVPGHYIYIKLEQLERLRSEDTPCRPVITHTIDQFVLNPKSILLTSSYRIPSQKKVKAEKISEKFKFYNFVINLTRNTPSKW